MTSQQKAILDEARTWIGTPYRHQASKKGEGADCLGLIRGVYRELIMPEPPIPAYTPNWDEANGEDLLLTGFREHLEEVPAGTREAGTVLVFRMGLGSLVKHAAFCTDKDTLIHAYWGRSVCETRLVPWWNRRVCAAFKFPEYDHAEV